MILSKGGLGPWFHSVSPSLPLVSPSLPPFGISLAPFVAGRGSPSPRPRGIAPTPPPSLAPRSSEDPFRPKARLSGLQFPLPLPPSVSSEGRCHEAAVGDPPRSTNGSSMATGSICDEREGERSAGDGAEMARTDGMAGLTLDHLLGRGRRKAGGWAWARASASARTERTWLGDWMEVDSRRLGG